MKSAYELALERMSAQGIERPREDSLTDAQRHELADVRRRAEAKLAELEILHRDKMTRLGDPTARAEQEEFFRNEREHIEADRERKVADIRARQR